MTLLRRLAAGLRSAAHLADEADHVIRDLWREWTRDRDLPDCARDVALHEEPKPRHAIRPPALSCDECPVCHSGICDGEEPHLFADAGLLMTDEELAAISLRNLAPTKCAACNAGDNVCDVCLLGIARDHERGAA